MSLCNLSDWSLKSLVSTEPQRRKRDHLFGLVENLNDSGMSCRILKKVANVCIQPLGWHQMVVITDYIQSQTGGFYTKTVSLS